MSNMIDFAKAKQNKENEEGKYRDFEKESIGRLEQEEALFQKRLIEQEDNLSLKKLIQEYKKENAELEAAVYQNGLLLDAGRLTQEEYAQNIAELALYGKAGELKQKLEEAFFVIYGI